MIALVIVQRLVELRHAERNRHAALQAGAKEFGAAHYPFFVVLHIGWLFAWGVEGFSAEPPALVLSLVMLMVFVLAQALRYWAIISLGVAWNTRILVQQGAERIRRGPYKCISHPNYIAVALELAAAPLIFGAWRTALVASICNAVILLFIRIPMENKAIRDFLK